MVKLIDHVDFLQAKQCRFTLLNLVDDARPSEVEIQYLRRTSEILWLSKVTAKQVVAHDVDSATIDT